MKKNKETKKHPIYYLLIVVSIIALLPYILVQCLFTVLTWNTDPIAAAFGAFNRAVRVGDSKQTKENLGYKDLMSF